MGDNRIGMNEMMNIGIPAVIADDVIPRRIPENGTLVIDLTPASRLSININKLEFGQECA